LVLAVAKVSKRNGTAKFFSYFFSQHGGISVFDDFARRFPSQQPQLQQGSSEELNTL
jgi:hypothetical protein